MATLHPPKLTEKLTDLRPRFCQFVCQFLAVGASCGAAAAVRFMTGRAGNVGARRIIFMAGARVDMWPLCVMAAWPRMPMLLLRRLDPFGTINGCASIVDDFEVFIQTALGALPIRCYDDAE